MYEKWLVQQDQHACWNTQSCVGTQIGLSFVEVSVRIHSAISAEFSISSMRLKIKKHTPVAASLLERKLKKGLLLR